MTTPATGSGPATVRTRILIIEDERDLTQVLTYNLQREGYDTIVAHDGQEGLRKAQTLLPDLILLDLMLPTMSGVDVCRELRAGERTRDIPIIILSARAEETDQIVGFSLGCDDYVTKPFSVKVLLQRIKASNGVLMAEENRSTLSSIWMCGSTACAIGHSSRAANST